MNLGSASKMRNENRRVVRAVNRPDIRPRNQGVLFHATGSTGWRRRRNLGDYKEGKKESDFSHLHEKFWGEGDEPV
jgi:hypothetical protein